MPESNLSNEMLGYPPEARLLIINADDFGMCYAINAAIIQTIQEGVVASCSLMVTCPWGLHATRLLKANPHIPFGVHLTAISEAEDYRWGPISSKERVPSLVDEGGFFYSEARMDEFLSQVDLDELEQEFRLQIDHVLNAGLKTLHIDSHCGVHSRRADIFEMTTRLAHEYGLALRVTDQPYIAQIRQSGYPSNDHRLLDSYHVPDPEATKAATYTRLLRELPPGLTEWAVHPGLESDELRAAIGPGWATRRDDYAYFVSEEAKRVIAEEQIILLDYQSLQHHWQTT